MSGLFIAGIIHTYNQTDGFAVFLQVYRAYRRCSAYGVIFVSIAAVRAAHIGDDDSKSRSAMSNLVRERSVQRLTHAQMVECLDRLRQNFQNADVISRNANRIVIRWRSIGGAPVIIKMWARPDIKGSLRRLLGVSASNYEWRNLVRMDKFGIAVPRPLGFLEIVPSIAGYTDVLFMEDLGNCVTATEHIKGLIGVGEERQILEFENELIELTARILEAGMIDGDHGMLNTVVTVSGRVVRLDLEIARFVLWPRCFPVGYGRMLGRMIGLHAFAVQPAVERTLRFAERLRMRLHPSQRVLRGAYACAHRMMQDQLQKTGINTELILPLP